MYGIGGVNTIFLHNALSASYKEKSCPVFVPFFSEKSSKLLSVSSYSDFAEDTGFEPVGPFSRLVFETSTINHSDNPPCFAMQN